MKAEQLSSLNAPAHQAGTHSRSADTAPTSADDNGMLVADLLEKTSDGVFMLGYDWRFIYLNAHARLFISSGKDLVGTYVWDEFPAAVDSLFWENYHYTMEHRVPTTFMAYYPEPLNAWYELHSYPTVCGISVFFRDITARRAEEERLRLLEQAVSSSPMGITIAELRTPNDCPIMYINPAFEALTGYSRDEVIGRDCRFLQGSDLQQGGRDELRLAIEQGSAATTVLRNYRKDGSSFMNEVHLSQVYDQAGKVTHVVGIQNDVTEQLETKAKLARQAQYDALTGLANRYLMMERLKQALEAAEQTQAPVAVVILDLDNFKHMNDRLGHIEADTMLVQIARRLNAAIDAEDTAARIGGDEFALILTNCRDQARVHRQIERLLQEIRKPVLRGKDEVIVTGSAGVAMYPQDGSDAETLLQMADLSMYWIKRRGKNSFRLYSSELRSNDDEALDLEAGLRAALHNEEFELFYQPRVSASSTALVGFEALIRWRHPTRGLLLPAQFIRIAEHTGLIDEIGTWALQQALKQNAKWRAEGLKPVSMSVNVSPAQVRDPAFPMLVAEALAKAGLPPESLELELTESILIDDAESADLSLQVLNQLGVRVAIDDFGTGFSGLQYLSRFAVDTIKIDHFFIRNISTDPTAATICHSILKLGQALGLLTVAEGVELKEQAALLRRWHCTELQGFMFARPLPSADARLCLEGLESSSFPCQESGIIA